MPSPRRTPRLKTMGATNHIMVPQLGGESRRDAIGARTVPDVEAADVEAARKTVCSQSARGIPRLSTLDRVRQNEDVPRAMTSRISTGNNEMNGIRNFGLSPRTSRRQLTPMEPIRSTRLPLGPAYVPGQFQVRAQDIVPRYEQSNPMMVKLVDTHRALSDNKQHLIKEFEQIDAKKTGSLSKKEFTDSLKEVNQKCKLNIPRVLLDDLCEEAAEMFAPDKDPVNPHDIVYYKDFVSALQAPSPDTPQTLEEACIASSPKAQMMRTARFIERPRLHSDFSILERQKAHIIQNDLRTLLSLRRGLDPGSGTRETFLKMDTDRDGIIGKEDLRATLLELGMPMRDDSMELILSYCDMDGKGGIDFTSFVNNFEAIGRGWFNPFVPHKRLPEPPFRPRADQTSPVYANFYPPSSTPSRQRMSMAPESRSPPRTGYIIQGQELGADIVMTDVSIMEKNNRTEQRRDKARRLFREHDDERKKTILEANAPLRKVEPVLSVDYHAVVAAHVQRERDSMLPRSC